MAIADKDRILQPYCFEPQSDPEKEEAPEQENIKEDVFLILI